MHVIKSSLFASLCLAVAVPIDSSCQDGHCTGQLAHGAMDASSSASPAPLQLSGELKRRAPRKCHKPYTTTSIDATTSTDGTTTYVTSEVPISTTSSNTMSASESTTTSTPSSTTTAAPTTSTTTTMISTTTTTTTTIPTTTATTTTTTTDTCSRGVGAATYSAILSSITASGIVPTVVPSLDPKLEVTVRYGSKDVNLGNTFSVQETLSAPSLSFNNEVDYDPESTTYSYFLVDPDVPNPNGVAGLRLTYLHWQVSGVRSNCVSDPSTSPATIAMYQSPTPASTDLHRYTFLVYREPSGYVPDTITPQIRVGFDVNAYAANGNLVLVGANFFQESILS